MANILGRMLVVDDDQQLQDLYVELFRRWQITAVWDAASALASIRSSEPSMVLLDLRLPDLDGQVLLPKIRRISKVPIVVCSARAQQVDVVTALNAGADDFVPKPFDIDYLEAAVEAVWRRSRSNTYATPEPEVAGKRRYVLGRLTVPEDKPPTIDGHELQITPMEHKVLVALAQQAESYVTRAEMCTALWGSSYISPHSIDVYMGRIRAKIRKACGDAPEPPGVPTIVTYRRLGFKMTMRPGYL